MSRICFLDTETTSLDDTRGEVWEIGLIVRDDDGDTEHLWQVRPDLSTASSESLRVGRFYERCRLVEVTWSDWGALRMPIEGREPDDQIDVRTPQRVAADLATLLDGSHVVGAGPDFDYRFLRRFLAANGQCWTANYRLIDVRALAVGYLHGREKAWRAAQDLPEEPADIPLPWNPTNLYRALEIDPDQFEAHTALGDARLARAVYDAVTGGDV